MKLKKRAPPKVGNIKKNDIFVSRKSKYHALLTRGKMLLEQGTLQNNFITIHGLGAAIQTAIDLALDLQAYFGGESNLTFNIKTDTVPLVDDFYSSHLSNDFYKTSQVRFNSAIHIICTRIKK